MRKQLNQKKKSVVYYWFFKNLLSKSINWQCLFFFFFLSQTNSFIKRWGEPSPPTPTVQAVSASSLEHLGILQPERWQCLILQMGSYLEQSWNSYPVLTWKHERPRWEELHTRVRIILELCHTSSCTQSQKQIKAPYDDGSTSTVNQQRKDGLSCLNVKARQLLWGTTRQSLWYHSRKEFLKQDKNMYWLY